MKTWGGKREGSGRKPGIPNKRVRTAEANAHYLKIRKGKTPLDTLAEIENRMMELAEQARAQKNLPKEVEYLRSAREAAALAAPFIHPRLQSTELKGDAVRPTVIRAPEVCKSAQEWLDKYAPKPGERLATPTEDLVRQQRKPEAAYAPEEEELEMVRRAVRAERDEPFH